MMAIAMTLLSSSCTFRDDNIHFGTPHGRDRHPARTVGTDGEFPPGDASAATADTVIYVSAVVYPEGYDWQRDTASGRAGARIVLFRNGVETVSVPVGDGRACADLDLHHIVDGHLYTEYIGRAESSLWCDGDFVCRYDAREYLKGIVRKDGDTYTLSCPCGGNGYSLRRNGEGIMIRSSGEVFGDFADPSYGVNGALYPVGGRICFVGRADSGNAVFVVRDGSEERVDLSARAPDVKIMESGLAVARADKYGLSWGRGTRMWKCAGEVWQTGDVRQEETAEIVFAETQDMGRYLAVPLAEASVYLSDKALAAVSWSQSGKVTVGMSGMENRELDGSWRYISDKCAALSGDMLCIALSAMDPGMRPVLMVGGRRTELPVNGFATEIRIETERKCL